VRCNGLKSVSKGMKPTWTGTIISATTIRNNESLNLNLSHEKP
jgi:hypothetical protein